MKRLITVCVVVFGMTAMAATRIQADSESHSVTAAGRGTFAAGAALGAVALHGLELGSGVLIDPDGSASGNFHAVLQGTTLGSARELTIEGTVSGGSIGADGRATFSGTASFDFGDGTPPLPAVPFQVTAGADGLVLVIDSTTLTAGLPSGGISIE